MIGIVVVAGVALMLYMTAATDDPPGVSEDQARTIVKFGRKFQIGTIIIVLLILAGMASTYSNSEEGPLSMAIGLLFFAGFLTYLLATVFRTKFEYDNDECAVTTAFRRTRVVPWSDIADISYSAWRSTYILSTTNGTKISVSEYLTGVDYLMDFARRWKNYNRSGK